MSSPKLSLVINRPNEQRLRRILDVVTTPPLVSGDLRRHVLGGVMDTDQLNRMASDRGFVAALDQSGGSTPGALSPDPPT